MMADRASNVSPLTTDESRCQQRTHLFVSAALCWAGTSSPVHIRNMSATGALLEGAPLPGPGASAMLKRGPLSAKVEIVWTADRRAGVAFASTVQVADWMSRTPPQHQARVDEAVRLVRSNPGANPTAERVPERVDTMIQTELYAARRELAEIEAGLVGDLIMVAVHPEIQLLDVVQQRIERILAQLSSA